MKEEKANKLIVFVLIFLVVLCVVALFFDLYLPSFDKIIDIKETTAEEKILFVNINTATLDELVTLPKIGEVIAQRIIDYRTTNGPFKAKEDIMKVSGIGNSIFNEIKDYIEVA